MSLRWRTVPIPGFVAGRLRNISVTGSWRTRQADTRTETGQDRGNEETARSVGLVFVLDNGFNVSYEYSNTASERVDATGLSQSDRASHSVRLSGFLPPPGFVPFLKRDIRLAVDYSNNGNSDCRALGGSGIGSVEPSFRDDCSTHTDQTTQNASLTLDTDFTGYSLGLQLTWVGRSSEVGRRQSSSQINFNLFGRFFFRSSEGDAQFNP